MASMGLRELRRRASELLRRAKAGEELTITVRARPRARLTPLARRAWRGYDDVAELFAGPRDASWNQDHDRLDQLVRGPWPPR
jgi:prevent-host-death family protein